MSYSEPKRWGCLLSPSVWRLGHHLLSLHSTLRKHREMIEMYSLSTNDKQHTNQGRYIRYTFEGGICTRVFPVSDKLTHSRPLTYCWGTLGAKYRACSPPRDMRAAQIIRCFPPSFLLSLMALGGIQTKTLPWLAWSLAALSVTEAACS